MIFARCTRSRAVRRIKALYTRPSFSSVFRLWILEDAVLIAAVRLASAPSVVKHVHLDFGDELLSGLFIPLNRHKFLRLFLVAANVTTGFMVDNQPFTRTDVGDNRVTWDRATALGEGDQHAIGAFDWQMTVVRRVSRHRRRSGFALLQVFATTTLIALPRPISASRSSSEASFMRSSSRWIFSGGISASLRLPPSA